MARVVLAYSGGLDTSIILDWLQREKGHEVIAFIGDVGQNEDVEQVRKKALDRGAIKVIVADLRETFVRDYVFPLMQSHAAYEGCYLLGTAAARPAIAKAQVDVALAEGVDTVAHGATGKGNDQLRFELAFSALAPHLKVIAPWREWTFNSRDDLEAYAKKVGIEVSPKSYSMDRNILHASFEGQELEDPWQEPGPGTYLMCRPISETPDDPEVVTITFRAGCPVAINETELSPVEILSFANEIAGRHGIGRVDMVESRVIGIKVRGVYETPGGTLLHAAHRAVESLTLDREVIRWKDEMMPKVATIVYNGLWFSPEMDVWKATLQKTQERVDGVARLRCHKGSLMVIGRASSQSLYDGNLASFNTAFNHADSTGFIRLLGMRLVAYSIQNSGIKPSRD